MLATRTAPTRLLSLLAAVATTAAVVPTPVRAAGTHATTVDGPTSVLGLEGDNEKAAAALTDALRKAFADRGMSGGQEVSLLEIRLTMGCENEEPACLADAGKSLQVRHLVYGHLDKAGKDYRLDICILDVETASVQAQSTIPIAAADLAPDRIDAQARRIVSSLLPGGEAPAPATAPGEAADAETEPVADEPPRRKSDSELVWGRHKPTPAWKWAGFGTSLGLAVAATGLSIGFFVKTKSLEDDVDRLAKDSIQDNNPLNDVHPTREDRCEFAAEDNIPGATDPNAVRNAGITEACDLGRQFAAANTATVVLAGVAGVSTVVFTVLLFVQRKKGQTAWQRRGIHLGGAPTAHGGFVMAGGMKF